MLYIKHAFYLNYTDYRVRTYTAVFLGTGYYECAQTGLWKNKKKQEVTTAA